MSTPQNIPSIENDSANLRQTNLRVISLLTMLGGWSLVIAYIIAYFISRDARFSSLIILGSIYGVALTAAWWLQRGGHYRAAIWLIFISTFATGVFFSYFVQGLGLTIGVLLAILYSIISWQILPWRSAIVAVIFSILAGALIFFADVNLAQGDRITGGFFLSNLLIIFGGIVAFILVINGLRSLEFKSISTQLQVSFLVVSILPVLIITIFQTATLTNVLTTQASNILLENAKTFASELDTQIFTMANYIEEDANNPAIINFLRAPDKNTASLALLAARYPNVISYGLLDTDGFLILDNRGNAGGNESDKTYFKNAILTRITYPSDVVLDDETRRGVFFLSKSVLDDKGNLMGVIRVKISADRFQQVAVEAAAQFGEGFSVLVLDDANIILAHSADPELRTTTISAQDKNAIRALQEAGRLPFSGKISANLDELDKLLKTTKTEQAVFTGSVLPESDEQAYITSRSISYKPWKILVAQSTTVFLAPVLNQVVPILLIILVLFAAVYFGANLTSAMLVTPVKRLTSAAQELGRGNLHLSIQLPRQDELGTLATVLDNTRQQVYELLQTLEQRVEERTSELTRANEKNERRARQLETIAQVARAVTSLRDLNQLLPEITQQISESFGYYHAGIFLLDENGEYAVLRAANSQGGQAMLARGHRLKVGRQGIVGNVTNTGRYRIALDVGDDAVFFNNPDLPQTRSEIALPLMIGENIIGALDVQSTEPNAFSEDDIKTLSLLSDQISVAIENARLFDEIRQTLAQLQETYAESRQAGWQVLAKEISAGGYRYARGSVEPLRKKAETAAPSNAADMLQVPIMLRGEKLGDLKIRRPGRQTAWTETEARMYQAIAERMSFALENARLFSDARRRANLERVAAEVTTKISSSVQVETILRTAAEEISHLMDGSEVLIQIQPGAVEKDNEPDHVE